MPEVTNPKMDALRAKLDVLETLRRVPLPTPEIGRLVLFHRHGDMTSTPIPGCVVDRCGPGQVDLKLFVKNSQNQENVGGIFYTGHPFARENPQVLKLKGGGLWSYCDGDRPTEGHKALHVAEIDRQAKNLRDELLHEREEQMRRDAFDKEVGPPRTEKTAKTEKVTSG